MPSIKQLTVESLTHLCESGQHQLAVDDHARSILRQWMLQSRASTNHTASPGTPFSTASDTSSGTSSSASAPLSTAPSTTPSPLSSPATPTIPQPSADSPHSRAPHPSAPDAQAPIQPRKEPLPSTEETLSSVEEKLAYLIKRAASWAPAKRLGSLRDTMVFSTGNPHARLMLVGEAPGHDEELQREPFVGPAGRKLNQILKAMGLDRQQVYISNICKFRPSMGEHQGTANRAPSDQEIAACLPLIQAEIRAIHPACIVCLGGCAAKGLLGTTASVGSLRGTWQECQGIPVRVTYHPSYLLRTDTRKARRDVWEDMLAVMQHLGLPISSRQQSYFL